MKIVQMGLAAFLVVGTATAAEDKADAKKLLVGKWEVVKADEGTLPKGATAEFTKDGKVSVGGGDRKHEGTYTVGDGSFTLVFKVDDAERKLKITIKRISDTELETANEEGKSVSFKRVK